MPTPQSPHSGDEGESDAVLGAVAGSVDQKGTTISGPVWRWVSNRSGMRVGVPNEVLSTGIGTGDAAKVGGELPVDELPKPRPPAICDVQGCSARRKYRLVRDFERGACGLEHLNILTGAA